MDKLEVESRETRFSSAEPSNRRDWSRGPYVVATQVAPSVRLRAAHSTAYQPALRQQDHSGGHALLQLKPELLLQPASADPAVRQSQPGPQPHPPGPRPYRESRCADNTRPSPARRSAGGTPDRKSTRSKSS